ncbi:LOW QUALITY PROTEIN: hypothetical protein OSB04_un000950 [Centaurea solstitialis]|uniref:RNA-directed DNA polymerase, eukaryota, Reverse transcriptase zinc-binding domain protein n=1 Tax=Centaurea solstitialis TaxID=347529 RepID=A0AA38W335_9ASTR|nr:LOW QUALITY PROTEIN: hypothetical protein OSB04_un000950 [Centaurea solstitialis]
MNKQEHWAPIISKFQSKLSKWKALTLSAGGRLILCKSVLVYTFSHYSSLQKKSFAFLKIEIFWGMKDDEKKIPWVAWSKICADLEDGGLGVGSLKAQNIALIAKWWWRFYTDDGGLWKAVIRAFHGPSGSLSSSFGGRKQAGLWRYICRIQMDLSKVNVPLNGLFRCVIGSNSNFSFWKDEWVHGGTLKDRFLFV